MNQPVQYRTLEMEQATWKWIRVSFDGPLRQKRETGPPKKAWRGKVKREMKNTD